MTIKEENHLAAMTQRHRDLDAQITAMLAQESYDDNEVTELKKTKLHLKDEITAFKKQLAETAKNADQEEV